MPHLVTMVEYTDLVLVYGTAAGNRRAAFGLRAFSTLCDFIANPVRQSYSVIPGKRYGADCGAPRRRRSPNIQEDILHHIEKTLYHCTWNRNGS